MCGKVKALGNISRIIRTINEIRGKCHGYKDIIKKITGTDIENISFKVAANRQPRS